MSLSHGGNPPQFYFNELLSIIEHYCQNSESKVVIYLEAGHYNSKFGVDDFALNSLQDAVDLGKLVVKKHQKNVRLVYGVLIDDLGLACSDEGCTLPQPDQSVGGGGDARLPDELEAFIAARPLIKRDKLMIFSERTSKNRAIESIKKKIKQGGDGLVITDNGNYSEIKLSLAGEIPFMLAKRKGDIFSAKCPAIISQHYKDVLTKLKQRFFETQKFMIVDWSEISDCTKVIQGKCALPVIQGDESLNNTIVNIFFGDDEGRIVQVKHSIPLENPHAVRN